MNIIKRILRLTSLVFSLGILGLAILGLSMGVEQVYLMDLLLGLAMILVIVVGIVLSSSLWFSNRFFNYIIPYVLVMAILLAGVYGVNYLNLSKYLDIRLVGLGFSLFYIVYALISYFFLDRRRDRIRF